MANGTKFGRNPKLSDYQRKEALKRAAGETLAGHCQVVRRRRQHDLTAWLIHDWGFAVHTRARRLVALRLSDAATSAVLAEHYRAQAEVCRQMAGMTVNPIKQGWLDLAAEWAKLAREAEAEAALERGVRS